MSVLKKKIGVIGGGQLGKMMILEAKSLGYYVVILDPAADCPASSISDEQIVAGFDTEEGYKQLAEKVDVITYEFEHINAKALEELEKQGHTIYPSVTSLKTIQNKYLQKLKLQGEGVLVPLFAKVASVEDIKEHGKEGNFGYPMMLKTTTGGYDGKGNALIRNEAEVETAFAALGGGKNELMVEAFVDFDIEISVTACRGIDGDRVIYPIAENMHRNSILDVTIVPARVSAETIDKATHIAARVMEVFEGVGTFCVEMFVAKNGDVYVNEVAPRPHNSGHYTIEGCFANQFENHVRGIVGLPFGCTDLISPTVMVNLLGESDGNAVLLGVEEAYKDPKVQVHFYGKPESKEYRKMGHYTVVDSTVDGAIDRAMKLKEVVRVVGE